jgi:hypothetical protein
MSLRRLMLLIRRRKEGRVSRPDEFREDLSFIGSWRLTMPPTKIPPPIRPEAMDGWDPGRRHTPPTHRCSGCIACLSCFGLLIRQPKKKTKIQGAALGFWVLAFLLGGAGGIPQKRTGGGALAPEGRGSSSVAEDSAMSVYADTPWTTH